MNKILVLLAVVLCVAGCNKPQPAVSDLKFDSQELMRYAIKIYFPSDHHVRTIHRGTLTADMDSFTLQELAETRSLIEKEIGDKYYGNTDLLLLYYEVRKRQEAPHA